MLKKEEQLDAKTNQKSHKSNYRNSLIKPKELQNNTKGITLVALVVTIIVLVILARDKYKYTFWR